MKQILIDSNFLFSMFYKDELNHQGSLSFTAQNKFMPVIPEITLTEVCFLFFRVGKVPAVVKFLQEFSIAKIQPIYMQPSDFQRASEIMSTYAKAELDFVDCSIMALSERLNITQVCTYDRRDFSIFRPKHCDYLELLP